MRAIALLFFALCLAFTTGLAQKIEKPTLTSKPPTEADNALIREGITLHDKKDFDGAIAKYKAVLVDNPDCTTALYELALSYYTKGDSKNAMEAAVRGSKYRSDQLALFYGLIANMIDDVGKPDEALKIYRDAIGFIKDDPTMSRHISSLHYNIAITYVRQKKYDLARPELKQAVELNYSYPSPHYLLSEVYFGTKYKVPAMLAAARFVTLEFNTQRTSRAAKIFVSNLQPPKKDEKTGNIKIFLDMNAPKDEGDFTMFDLLLGTLGTVKSEKEPSKTQGEIFVESVKDFIGLLAENKGLRKTFVGKAYIPYMAAMYKAGHTTAFAYLMLRQAGEDPEATKWTQLNMDKVQALLDWAKNYGFSKN